MPIIAAPGSFAGPCYDVCDHLGCEHDRWVALQPCALCAGPIGFDQPYDVLLDATAAGATIERLGYQPFVMAHRACVNRELAEASPADRPGPLIGRLDVVHGMDRDPGRPRGHGDRGGLRLVGGAR
jgi:hypothetical protein